MFFFAVISCVLGGIGAIVFLSMVAEKIGGGCLSKILCFILFGGYIYGNGGAGVEYGAQGVTLFNLIGIILGIFGLIKTGSGSSSSNGPSISDAVHNWAESRETDPHTCGNCREYSSVRGECKISGNSMSAADNCGNWR